MFQPLAFRVLFVALLFTLCFFIVAPVQGQVIATWTDSSGNWSNGANWSTNPAAPANGGGLFYNVVINGTGSDTVTFDASGTVINSLSIGQGETLQDNGVAPTLTIGDPNFPTSGTLTNNGTVNWSNGANLVLDISSGNGSVTNNGTVNLTNSTLAINDSGNGNTATLSGAGTVNLSGALITGRSGDETLTNNSTIQGSGTISNLSFVNNGTLNANGSAALTLGGVLNGGALNVTGSGGLIAGGIENSGTGGINVSGSGGLIAGSLGNDGSVSVTGSGGLIVGSLGRGPANLGGSIVSVTGSQLIVNGNASVQNMTVNSSTLNVAGTLTVAGGELSLSNTIGTIGSLGIFDPATEANGSSLTVTGDVNIGSLPPGSLTIGGSTLNVQGNFTCEQSGCLTLSGGSSARISGGFFVGDSAPAVIEGSSLSVGGNAGAGDAFIFVQGGGVLSVQGNFGDGASIGAAGLNLTGGSSAAISGNIVQDGNSRISLSDSTLAVGEGLTTNGDSDNEVTLQGGSILTVAGTFANQSTTGVPNSLELLGAGNAASFGAVQNGGLIEVDAGSALTVTGGGFGNGAGGTLTLGGTVNVLGGFSNSGGSTIVNPAAILVTDSYSQSAGLTDVSGTLSTASYTQSGGATTVENGGALLAKTFTAAGGTVTVNGLLEPTAVEIGSSAALQGTGTIVGNVALGGTILPGSTGVPGTLTIVGNYEQLNGGILDELIGPSSSGILDVAGDVALDSGSVLQITLSNGYDPLGQTFDIMNYAALVGQFSNSTTFWDDSYLWDISYGENQIDVTAVQAPEPGTFPLLGVSLIGLVIFAKRTRLCSR